MNEWFSLETCHPSHSWQAFYFRDFCSTCLSNAIHWEFHMVFYPDGAQDKKMAFWHAGKLGCQKPSQFTVLFIIQWLARELIAVSWAPGWWCEGADFKQKLESALGKESAVVGRRGLKSEKFLSPALALQPWTSHFTSLGLLTDFTNDRHKLSSVFPKSGCVPESSEKLFIHFTFFGQTHGIRKFSGQVSSLRHSSDLSHGSDNAGSLTLCATKKPQELWSSFRTFTVRSGYSQSTLFRQ